MSALATRIEKEAGRPLTPLEIFDITAARESALSRLLMLYIGTGLVFMLLPGTFLGVWNLMAISSRRSAESVSAAWIQAHGHAQIFGWIGTFILGIGFYSIPKLRRMKSFALSAVWSSWVLWTSGATLRWLTGVYPWHWRVLLPLSAALELAAFVIFFRTVSGHRPQGLGKDKEKKRQAGRMGVGGDRGIGGPAAHTPHQLRSCLVSRSPGRVPRTATGFRPALSGAPDVGFPRAVRLGIQRQVAPGFSRIASGTRACAAAGSRSEFRRRDCRNDGMD